MSDNTSSNQDERTGEAFEFDEKLTVIGRQLSPGDTAPDFVLDHFDPETNAVRPVRLADTHGVVRILNVVNSLDTPVCHTETRRFEQARRDELPHNVVMYTISMDLPFAQARWCGAEQVGHQALSAHRSEQFGKDYGVLLKEWRLLQRAVFVIDRGGRLVHVEYVGDQMAEPHYHAAFTAARFAATL